MKMSPAQRKAAAIDRMEDRAMILIERAEEYAATFNDIRRWDQRFARKNLLNAARRYASSVNQLGRKS